MTDPPHSLDAEETVIGAALLDEHAISACAEILDGHEFYRPSHGLVWKAIVAQWRDGKPADAITVLHRLEAEGTLDDAGGRERIHLLAALAPAAGNARHHAQIVRDLWIKRELAAMFAAGHYAASNGMPPAEIVDRLERRTLDLRTLLERAKRRALLTTAELSAAAKAEFADPPVLPRGIQTPFPRTLRRLMPGQVTVLAGYTRHGKTVLAVQYVRAACSDGARVGVFSIEMTREQLYDRMLACFGIPLRQIAERRVGPVYEHPLAEALARTASWQAEVNDDRAANHQTFRRWQKLRRYDLLVIDHLHEIDVGGAARDRRINLETEVLRIASVARDLEVPVLLLAQLSRPQGTREEPRPTLAMLRETGKIEQEAAVVQFVWRKSDDGTLGPDGELIVAKDRFGPEGKLALRFDGECVRFTEATS